jgi:uncharacterized membrane protein
MKLIVAVLVGVVQMLCLAALPNAAVADALPEVGQSIADHVELFGKRILLPPGEWRVASESFGRVVGEDPGPYGTIGSVLLTRAAEDAMPSFVLISTNAAPVVGGWGPPPECANEAVLWQSVAEPRDLHNACTFVVAARAGRIAAWSGDPSVYHLLPPWALVAGFRVSDRKDVVEARYGVVPKSGSQATWFGTAQTLDQSQKQLLERLGDWARQARQASFAALRDPLDQVPPIPPMVLAPDKAGTASAEDITSLRLGLYKLATYRGPVTAWNWALASVLSGSLYVGATVAAWQSITHSAIYFGNEMAWEMPTTVPAMRFVATSPVAAKIISIETTSTDGGYTLAGKQVPLPSGAWTVLAQEADTSVTAVLLARIDGNVLRGLVVVRANVAKTSDIFGTASDCSSSGGYFSIIRYDTPVDGYCSYAKPVFLGGAGDDEALWTKGRARLAEVGVSLPPVLLEVGARARTRENVADVRYYFPPDDAMTAVHLAATDIVDRPALRDQVMALQAWADLIQLPLEQGVRGRMVAPAGVPWPWQMAAVHEALTSQVHAPIERLRAAGAIDDTELQRQLALADAWLAERERQRWSLWVRSAYKVATYRILSYFDAIAVSWIITLSPEQSFAYATINAVAQPIMAYVNEIGWAGSGVGRAAAPLQPVDFPDIGRDQL